MRQSCEALKELLLNASSDLCSPLFQSQHTLTEMKNVWLRLLFRTSVPLQFASKIGRWTCRVGHCSLKLFISFCLGLTILAPRSLNV